MKQVESYFKDYPGSKECFTTSDGLVFHNKYDANLHANSLEDKEVEEHKASKYKEQKPAKEGKKSEESKGPKETEKPKDLKDTEKQKESKDTKEPGK